MVMKNAAPTTASVSHFRRWVSVIRCSFREVGASGYPRDNVSRANLFHRARKREARRHRVRELMPKVAPACEDHRRTGAVDCLDDLGITPRATRLDDRRDA